MILYVLSADMTCFLLLIFHEHRKRCTPLVKNWQCGFKVHSDEMARMRAVIVEWGAEAVKFFEKWRTCKF